MTTRTWRLSRSSSRALNTGQSRAAEPDPDSLLGWRVNAWVKRGILVGFRMGRTVEMTEEGARLQFFDKSTYPTKAIKIQDSVRIVPGGSSIRDGVYLGTSVTCMPPMYINVGAYVDDGTMVDSHALVGSCAQIGKNCHLSAAAQIGGVLEPVGAVPVIIEDGVLVGGNCGVYEGTIVRENAVLGAGTVLTRSHSGLRRSPRRDPPCYGGTPANHPEGRGRCSGIAADHLGQRTGVESLARGSGNHQIPRREDGSAGRARGPAPLAGS